MSLRLRLNHIRGEENNETNTTNNHICFGKQSAIDLKRTAKVLASWEIVQLFPIHVNSQHSLHIIGDTFYLLSEWIQSHIRSLDDTAFSFKQNILIDKKRRAHFYDLLRRKLFISVFIISLVWRWCMVVLWTAYGHLSLFIQIQKLYLLS